MCFKVHFINLLNGGTRDLKKINKLTLKFFTAAPPLLSIDEDLQYLELCSEKYDSPTQFVFSLPLKTSSKAECSVLRQDLTSGWIRDPSLFSGSAP